MCLSDGMKHVLTRTITSYCIIPRVSTANENSVNQLEIDKVFVAVDFDEDYYIFD